MMSHLILYRKNLEEFGKRIPVPSFVNSVKFGEHGKRLYVGSANGTVFKCLVEKAKGFSGHMHYLFIGAGPIELASVQSSSVAFLSQGMEQNREDMKQVIKEISKGIRNQLYDRLSNDLRRSMNETIGAVERNGRNIKNLIMEIEKTKERSRMGIEQNKEEQLETWKQFLQAHQKWEQETTHQR